MKLVAILRERNGKIVREVIQQRGVSVELDTLQRTLDTQEAERKKL